MKRYFSLILFLISFMAGITEAETWRDDPSEANVGIHLLSDYGSGYTYLSQGITPEKIRLEINKLDWKNRFYQYVVVTKPGISMEVGGSLNPKDGLSAMFRDRHNRIDAVIISPPSTVDEMSEILIDFIKNDDSWKEKYNFEFTKY